jgi:hypothetical protein
MQDVQDYLYLVRRYDEAANKAEEAMKKNEGKGKSDSIEQRFYLTQLKVAKEMRDDLGIEVPDEKAKEWGFGDRYENKKFTATP